MSIRCWARSPSPASIGTGRSGRCGCRAPRHAMDLAAKSVTFGTLALTELRASHVETWVKTMQDKGLEPTTVRTRFANVRNVLRAAVRDRCMPSDVADRVRLPRQRKASAAMTIPTAEEVGAVIWVGRRASTRCSSRCAHSPGCAAERRPRCRVGDIDFLRKEIHVSRQVQWTDDGRMEIRPPKYGSERTVFIPDGLATLLGRARPALPAGRRSRPLAVPRQPGRDVTRPRGDGGPFVADRPRQGGHRAPAARSAALLRLRADSRGLRRGDGAAGARALIGLGHAGHLQPLVAGRRTTGPARPLRACSTRPSALLRTHCGRSAENTLLTRA